MPYSVSVGQPSLGAVPEDAVAKPHHVKAGNGQTTAFQNPTPSAAKAISNWQIPLRLIKGHIDGSLRLPWPAQDEQVVAVHDASFLPTRFPAAASQGQGEDQLRTTWLGHACHYIEFSSGLRVLLDPVLEDRCSPFTFMGPRRYTRRACPLADLPFLDAVIISHSHYDHLSLPTIKEIARLFPNAHFFVGLGLASWFRASGVTNVTEMDWWEDVQVEVAFEDAHEHDGNNKDKAAATISCLPAQHTSSRYGYDQNKTLWCSWAIRSGRKSVYFGGDTGYRAVPSLAPGETEDDYHFKDKYAHLPTNPAFAQIGQLRGPFDLGLIPIGAYKPRFLFSWMHADPFDAVDIFRDTRCKKALGIHWGTWALTSEPVMEPPERLKMALKKRGLDETELFDVCDIGESRTF